MLTNRPSPKEAVNRLLAVHARRVAGSDTLPHRPLGQEEALVLNLLASILSLTPRGAGNTQNLHGTHAPRPALGCWEKQLGNAAPPHARLQSPGPSTVGSV